MALAMPSLAQTAACLAPLKPVITASGVVNAASFQAGVAPGAWISIFGQNLGAYKRTLLSSDIAGNAIPTAIGGVSVQINGKPAYMQYVNASQINVLAPGDSVSGSVQVVVTNSGVASDAVSVPLTQSNPGLFTVSGYLAAVTPAGSLVTSAKPGDVIQLYGNGFGATNPAAPIGTVFTGSYPLAATPTVTIGGAQAQVSYAGLVAAGLYQINLTVPSLANGDHEVIAVIGAVRTQPGALLKVGN